jgi:multicomponent Na+:H+ antiporter subunit E
MSNPFKPIPGSIIKRILRPIFLFEVFLGTFVWMIWSEAFGVSTFLEGMIVSCICFGLVDNFLLSANYGDIFWVKPLTLVKYLSVLFVSIIQSGIHAIHITLSGNMEICAVSFPTKATNPFHGMLIGSAITLTPGTVTLDYSGDTFTVIWIERPTEDPLEAGEIIKGNFEKVLSKDFQENSLNIFSHKGKQVSDPSIHNDSTQSNQPGAES